MKTNKIIVLFDKEDGFTPDEFHFESLEEAFEGIKSGVSVPISVVDIPEDYDNEEFLNVRLYISENNKENILIFYSDFLKMDYSEFKEYFEDNDQ